MTQTIMSAPTTRRQDCLLHGSREHTLDRFFEAFKINRLGEVFREACLPGLAYILFATKATERYSRQILLETHFTH